MSETTTDTATTTQPDRNDVLQATIDSYFECWNSDTEEARMDAIRRTWADGARSTDPLADVSGHADIAAMMAGVEEGYPGHRFRQVGVIDVHHDLVRWGWEMVDQHDEVFLAGIDVAWTDEAGKLTTLAGFFGADVPAA